MIIRMFWNGTSYLIIKVTSYQFGEKKIHWYKYNAYCYSDIEKCRADLNDRFWKQWKENKIERYGK